MVNLGNSWNELLKDEFEKEYYLRLREFLKAEYANPAFPVYPKMNDIFNALRYTDYHAVKAVIIGQDPYHGENHAHGLSFSVKDGV
ncbi:MAG: uracil-DNA glycosylase, partial [Clostridia bacterium]|nr:uracil-DNA glycosylase [Clostridia bacterium]